MLEPNIFKKPLVFRFFLFSIFYFVCFSTYSQDLADVDSLLLDRDIENYSVRVFSNYKVNKFSIANGDSRVKYVPNNRYGLGFGFANKKIIVDIAFNVRNPNKEKTKRFDFQANTILKDQHYVNVFLQTYKGFNTKYNFEEPTVFRSDIRSVNLGFNYLYTFDDIEFSYSQLKAGISKNQNKNVFITGGIGLFGVYDYFSADSNILSDTASVEFNEFAEIQKYNGRALGVLAGFFSYFKLPENINVTLNVMPGIALINKKVTLQDASYRPSNPMLYKLDFLIGAGYNLKQYYVVLTYSNGLYTTGFGNDNKYRFNLSKAKLAIGYKFKRRNKK